MSVVQTRGGVRFSLGGERRGGGLWGAPSGGHRTGFLLFSLPGGPDPPWCSTDPASPTAALQKGLCWGVCRLYPGLRGCVRRRKRRRRG